MKTVIGTSCGGEKVFRYIVNSANKEHPKLLYIPADGYSWMDICVGYKIFGIALGCQFDYLALLDKNLDKTKIRDKILSSDIIFVGGGSAFHMLQTWNHFQMPKYIREAYDYEIVLSGLSAGAIAWFKYGNGDSNFYMEDKKHRYRKVVGTGVVRSICYPHYNVDNDKLFAMIMKMYNVPAIALEDGSSIVVRDDKYMIMKNSPDNVAYRFVNKDGKIYKKIIDNEDFLDLKEVL